MFPDIMIKEVLEKKGLNVLIGGNAGGGFQGYTQLILEAEFKKTERDYDVMKLVSLIVQRDLECPSYATAIF